MAAVKLDVKLKMLLSKDSIVSVTYINCRLNYATESESLHKVNQLLG